MRCDVAATIAKAAICVLPIIPAVKVNLDAAAGQGEAWTIFAIGSVMAGAVFIELCLEGRGFVKTALFAMLATFFRVPQCPERHRQRGKP